MLLMVLMHVQCASSKHTGFEAGLEEIFSSYTSIVDVVERSFSTMHRHMFNVENYRSNEELFNDAFASDLQKMISLLEDRKIDVYSALRGRLVSHLLEIDSMTSGFLLKLEQKYQDVLKFLAIIDEGLLSREMLPLFKEFLQSKQYFFFQVSVLKDHSIRLARIVVNIYDHC